MNNGLPWEFGTLSFVSAIFFVIFIIAFISIWIFVIKNIVGVIRRQKNMMYFTNSVINNVQNAMNNINVIKYKDISKAKLEEFHIDDLGQFKNTLYSQFESFEKAYNSLDYNTMKQISTSQVYENYYTGIKLNIEDGKKKVIDNIKREKVYVFDIYSNPTSQTVKTLMTITYISYTIGKNGYIISGSKDRAITENFEVTFQKQYSKENFSKCPNCGATISGNKCDYCRVKIQDREFKISSIKKVIMEDK